MSEINPGPLLARVVAQAMGLPLGEAEIVLRQPKTIQSNRLYDVWADGHHLIAKEFLKPDEWDTAPAREYSALQRVAALDIAPQPLFYDAALGPIVVYEYLEGEMWDRQAPAVGALVKLAQLWARLHALPAEGLWVARGSEQSPAELVDRFRRGFTEMTEWYAHRFPAGTRGTQHCLEILERRLPLIEEFESHEPVLCFCRSDARFANVITRPDGRLGMVDWEDSGLRDPALDLADLVTAADQEDLVDWAGWQPFLAEYLSQRGQQDPGLAARLHLYLAYFPLFWLLILMQHGIRHAEAGALAGWSINGLPANLRLRRYLARAAAWPNLEFVRELTAFADIVFFPDP
jgi:aminoglycoside phosphotransferase (APT) family kinase protein